MHIIIMYNLGYCKFANFRCVGRNTQPANTVASLSPQK